MTSLEHSRGDNGVIFTILYLFYSVGIYEGTDNSLVDFSLSSDI